MAPRVARIEIPGVPLHVTQRGVNRCTVFHDDQDRRCYIRLLREACAEHQVDVHAYALMGNHVHLLLAAARAGAISSAMRIVGQSHAQRFNLRHGRCGALWQGRFKSCLVGDDRYLLTVIRYIELNPVRAGLAAMPGDYRWSSVHLHTGCNRDPWLTPHPLYLALGRDVQERSEIWRGWLQQGIPADDIDTIRRHLAQERALGGADFQRDAERFLGRPVAWRRPGRPALSQN